MNKDLIFIDNATALARNWAQLRECSWLAVDTEFERSKTYYPQLCLLQIASGEITTVIDCLAVTDLDPVFAVLYDPAIVKVFHAARQDLEIFFHLTGKLPAPIFDTQLAAQSLGYENQIGYASLVWKLLGIELAKSQTRTNWKRRPLNRKQLDYAADDVIYLGQAYRVLLEKLNSAQLSQLEDECKALARPELYLPAPENMWLKIRNANRLESDIQAVLKQLAAWRERTARKENRPRSWILQDYTLVKIAQAQPASQRALSRINGVHEQIVKRHGKTLVEIVGLAVTEGVAS